MRRSSIILFGNLTKFGSGRGEDTLFEQIMNGLVTLLLHLQDPKPDVVKVTMAGGGGVRHVVLYVVLYRCSFSCVTGL